MLRFLMVLAAVLALIGCRNTPSDPALQTAGPAPSDPEASVQLWMASNLKDPYSVKDFRISEPRRGSIWTGTLNQGAVPTWYVCTVFNAKNSFGAYGGLKIYAMFIRNDFVVMSLQDTSDPYHEFDCSY